jgi:two-component system, sensor histidine kinase
MNGVIQNIWVSSPFRNAPDIMRNIIKTWNSLVNAGTDGLMDQDPKKGICAGVNLISLSICLINLLAGPAYYLLSKKSGVLFGSLFEAIFVAGLIGLNYLRKYTLANIGFFLIVNVATFYFGCLLGKLVEAQLMIVFLIGLVLFMFEKASTRIICTAITILVLVLLEMNFKYECFFKPIQVTEGTRNLMRWTSYAVIIFLVILIFYLYARDNKLLLARLQEYSKQIEVNLEKEKNANHTKGVFIRNAYHEVRSSFFGVFVIIQLLFKSEKPKEFKISHKHIAHLLSASENLKMVINNMLEYSKFEAGIHDEMHLEPVDLRLMMGNLVEIRQYSATEKKVIIKLDISKEIPEYIICDRLKITQIATNLINNAIKFTRSESEIKIIIEREFGYLKMSVKDEGSGISPGKMDTIFDPFTSEKNGRENQEGIGLDLYITKHLVELMNGDITVTSEIGATCFTVSIPFINAEKERENLVMAI